MEEEDGGSPADAQELVEAIKDPRVVGEPTGIVADLMQGNLLQVGSLFSVKNDSDGQRIAALAKLASLYWEINSLPRDGDGVPFTYFSVYNIKEGKASSSDRSLAEEWPRGFKVDVGEELDEDRGIVRFVSILAPKTIQGSKASLHGNFTPSKAGQISQFVRSYLGLDDVKIYFTQNSRSLHLQTGGICHVQRRGAEVRGLVLERGAKRWAIIPGHGVLSSADRGKPLDMVLDASRDARVIVDYHGALREVGRVDSAYLADIHETDTRHRRTIDAAFCRIERLASSVGFGQYVTLAPAIVGALVSDWIDFQGRLIVTLDTKDRIRWGKVSAHLASKHLSSSVSGHRFIITNALQVRNVGGLPFADPGMSGSLAFLTPEGSQPGKPITSEISLIGYVIGRSRYHSVASSGDNFVVNSKNSIVSEDYTIQLLQDVTEAFQHHLMSVNNQSAVRGVER